eukprot:jgi/Botrbrau1/18911/Bobra.177_2s0068.1
MTTPRADVFSRIASFFFGNVRVNRKKKEGGFKVVITGSSKGLGLALSEKFLELGDHVVISARNERLIDDIVNELQEKYPDQKVRGIKCDVAVSGDTEALADYAVQELGAIDIWINNAGRSQVHSSPLLETAPEELKGIVDTNLTGSIFGSRAAMRVMARQDTGGRIFLMAGRGSLGGPTPLNVAYGATKRALPQLKASLAKEVQGTKTAVHIVSPGMVATELLLRERGGTPAARIINILAEDAATVADWLVPRMRGVLGNGADFKFLTMRGVLWRFLTCWSRRGRFLPEKLKPH